MKALEILGGGAKGRRFSIYVPSRDKDGRSIDHVQWMNQAMNFLTGIFGRCTAMPELKGIWSDPHADTPQRETTNIVFSYVTEEEFTQHAEAIRDFLQRMGREAHQAEIGYEYDGEFYTLPIRED